MKKVLPRKGIIQRINTCGVRNVGDTGSGAGGQEGELVEMAATVNKLVVSGAGADRPCSSLDLWFCIRCTTTLSHSLNSVMMGVSHVVQHNTYTAWLCVPPLRRCATLAPLAPLLTHLWSVLSLPSLQPSTDAGWCVSADTINGRFYNFLVSVVNLCHDKQVRPIVHSSGTQALNSLMTKRAFYHLHRADSMAAAVDEKHRGCRPLFTDTRIPPPPCLGDS
ncbi:hypothetical protein E2C01_015483 [Portunus trituberculatus]|uniref:Uncharacterized protein n=1 Tax=Portunus trituberculatus TaxID=210409 RepID=A0A5B7DLZ7_PORTR|nr:hypothetical protein [Portunus trituberculatus]